MTNSEIDNKRLAKLKKLVAYHREKYHLEDKPEISDEAYDALVRELADLEIKLEGQKSTSEQVGGSTSEAFAKVKHEVLQWSFDNVFDLDELTDWAERAKRLLRESDIEDKFTFVAEHKIDGLKLILTYKKGLLIRAVTRGDGVVGEDVTHTAKTIKEIPEKLNKDVDLICVGEVLLFNEDFLRLNRERAKNNETLFANPRNAAAGSLRQLDPEVARSRNLSYIAYDIDKITKGKDEITLPKSQLEELSVLFELGLPTNSASKWCKDLNEVEKYYQTLIKQRAKLPYGIDGVVVKINEINVQEALGYTAKAPRFGIAYKLPAEQVTTVIEAIDLQVGRTGVVTPVAHLRPVKVAGSVVARATLHNEDQIKRLDIRVGDTIILQKAGDVIPEVVGVIKELRPAGARPYKFPTHVSGCGGDGLIHRLPGEVAHRCVVTDSPLLHRRYLHYFVSKVALNIDGVGPSIIDQLLEAELISTPADLFTLEKSELLNLPGFKDKSADNVIQAIEQAKKQPLYRFIVALSIGQVGEETARLLARHYADIDKLSKASVSELERIHGVGITIAEEIYNWFQNPQKQTLLQDLLNHIEIVNDEEGGGSNILVGETVVVTGTLANYSRDEIKDVIRQNGGTVSNSVSKKTTFVLVGENPGSKMAEAEKLGVRVMEEKEFTARLAGN